MGAVFIIFVLFLGLLILVMVKCLTFRKDCEPQPQTVARPNGGMIPLYQNLRVRYIRRYNNIRMVGELNRNNREEEGSSRTNVDQQSKDNSPPPYENANSPPS